MKKILIWVAIFVILAITNPSKSQFIDALTDKGISMSGIETKDNSALGAIGNALATALLKPALQSNTTAQDFILFTTFRTTIMGKQVTSIGILKHFILFKGDGKGVAVF